MTINSVLQFLVENNIRRIEIELERTPIKIKTIARDTHHTTLNLSNTKWLHKCSKCDNSYIGEWSFPDPCYEGNHVPN